MFSQAKQLKESFHLKQMKQRKYKKKNIRNNTNSKEKLGSPRATNTMLTQKIILRDIGELHFLISTFSCHFFLD